MVLMAAIMVRGAWWWWHHYFWQLFLWVPSEVMSQVLNLTARLIMMDSLTSALWFKLVLYFFHLGLLRDHHNINVVTNALSTIGLLRPSTSSGTVTREKSKLERTNSHTGQKLPLFQQWLIVGRAVAGYKIPLFHIILASQSSWLYLVMLVDNKDHTYSAFGLTAWPCNCFNHLHQTLVHNGWLSLGSNTPLNQVATVFTFIFYFIIIFPPVLNLLSNRGNPPLLTSAYSYGCITTYLVSNRIILRGF